MNAFILMPFDKKFNDIYELGIKATCEKWNIACERVDEDLSDENILNKIYKKIREADIMISDMTGQNPNVYYETGYAHALDKRVVLTTHTSSDIPFDFKHFPHIIYDGNIMLLQKELGKKLEWCKQNPKQVSESVCFPDLCKKIYWVYYGSDAECPGKDAVVVANNEQEARILANASDKLGGDWMNDKLFGINKLGVAPENSKSEVILINQG